ncbi:HAMP domain-containing histidine kinase [bacterium]|nr:MAG: HAMP domain-containing histidine kinase [bacterium]
MKLRLGIGQRLTIWWVALFAVGLAIYSVLAAAWVEHAHERALFIDLLTQAKEGVTAVDPARNRFTRAMLLPAIAGYALVSYVDGRPGEVRGVPPSAAALARAMRLPVGQTSYLSGDPAYLVAVAAAPGSESRALRVAVFADNEALEEEEERVRAAMLASGVPMLLFAALTGWLLARGALAPIDRITATASEVARSGRLSARLRLSGDDELGRLARTFDEMLERLEASFERERAFIGEVSHELRQPLAALGAEAELTLLRKRDPLEYARALETIHERAERLSRTIDDLLLLARADAGVMGRTMLGEVNEAVSEACAELQRSRPGIPVELRLREESLMVPISAPLLTRMVANLVANARRAAHSLVRVDVATRDGRAVVTVDDDGSGVPQAEREAIFRRFYRRSDDGTGLGLPIAAAVARAGGGGITVEECPSGGARFVIVLPIAG